MRAYEAVFARMALEFLLRASEDEVAEVEGWDATDRASTTRVRCLERDEAWRDLHVTVLSYTAITDWADNASCKVRVCRIERLRDQWSRRR